MNQERFSERVVFHVTPSMRIRIDKVIEEIGRLPSDALRLLMEEIVERYEGVDRYESAENAEQLRLGEVRATSLESQLNEARAEIRGLQEVNRLLNERLGLADAQNVELNNRLQEAHTTVDRVTLMLPAAGDAGRGRWSWRFWRR